MGRLVSAWLGLFFLLLTVGLVLLLGFNTLLDMELAHAGTVLTGAFFVMGLLGGLILRHHEIGYLSGLLLSLGLVALLGFGVSWLMPFLIADREVTFPIHLGGEPGWLIALATLAGLILTPIKRRAGGRDPDLGSVTDEEALQFINDNNLFVPRDELERIAAGSRGFQCGICHKSYIGNEGVDGQWKNRWVRCPKDREHLFHAYDFEAVEWRCPVDRTLLYSRKR